ncbi:MAG: helix-turn-helix domain-containing protein [Clostridia bacterium]|nr:helix-turn-helix domain-containing protein [Clostridia bacterium]
MNLIQKLNVLMKKNSIKNTNQLSKLTSIPYTTLKSIFDGDVNDVRYSTSKKLCEFFGISLDELLDDNVELGDFKIINSDSKQVFPLLGTVKAGYNYLAEENFIGYIYIDKEVSDPENYFALKVTGDSMQPVLYDNDIVIVHQQNDVENGQIGIVLIDGEEATVKKIVKYDEHIDLIAFNSYYPPRKLDNTCNFKIIGKVVEARISKIFE